MAGVLSSDQIYAILVELYETNRKVLDEQKLLRVQNQQILDGQIDLGVQAQELLEGQALLRERYFEAAELAKTRIGGF